MEKLLKDLANSGLVQVTGSYADGTQNENSDIDFRVKPDHPDYLFLGRVRNIVKIKNILDKHKIAVKSDMTGYWFTHQSNNDLPIQLEFSDLYYKRKNKLPEVEIFGVKFRTY